MVAVRHAWHLPEHHLSPTPVAQKRCNFTPERVSIIEVEIDKLLTAGFIEENNEAEYEALLSGQRLAKELAIKKLAIHSDSQLIMNQASGEYMAKHPRIILYLDKVQELLKAFPTFTIQQVPLAENGHANALASLGSALDTQFRRSI
ncbi:hypothetical protein L3X38_032966 [Prunus dulcis]|uniref:RNase H type-1 domain-containing protein n=1 Tax=Prunus dulcis TaxID=3755 RepID=A0AAD4VG70_PRUDU|nr:hypothetical protein L3X38_032966 [Prunus dulcis]